jgi:hypothetical protein
MKIGTSSLAGVLFISQCAINGAMAEDGIEEKTRLPQEVTII